MNVLVLNCGSSSLKFQVIQTDPQTIAEDRDKRLVSGLIERIGSQSLITLRPASAPVQRLAAPLRDHRAAVDYILKWLVSPQADIPEIRSIADIQAVGHRVVHGGERFTKSVVIDEQVLEELGDMIELAPLHNPANISGIKAAREVLGAGVPMAAVFDTAFHHTLPEQAYLYAIPYQFYRRYKVRRYGFHGTSHRYVAYRYRQLRKIRRNEVNAITLHLGNGSSACAIRCGNSIDTSMGLTPLEGLVMGTRSGDVDPAVLDFIAQKEGLSLSDIDSLLNRNSGLLGISGLTNDMRELLDEEKEHQDRRAHLAIELYCYRARKYIGAYLAALGSAEKPEDYSPQNVIEEGNEDNALESDDSPSTAGTLTEIAIIFTGGIGENSVEIRRRILRGLSWFGLELDETKNEEAYGGWEGCISKPGKLTAYVIPTNEELLIARDTMRVIENIPQRF
jgi:acetate kinase